MKLDRSKFIETFRSEAEGYLSTLNQGLVKLEKDSKNAELLNELFRVAHTLKGASRMMGFAGIRDVAHKIEDIFGALKEGSLTFNTNVADCVFQALDAISKGIANISQGKEEEINVEEICKNLVAVSCGEKVEARSKKQEKEEKLLSSQVDKLASSQINGLKTRKLENSKTSPPSAEAPAEEYIRVPLNRINELLNLIGEMVINKVKSSYKMGLFKRLSKRAKATEKLLFDLEPSFKEALGVPDLAFQHHGAVLHASQEMEKAAHVLNSLHNVESLMSSLREEMVHLSDDVQTEIFHLGPIIDSLQQKMKEIRMLPCSTVFEGFPRLVRDIANGQKKEVELIIKGEETELDKKVLEAIKGPLIHILRNAVDHGIVSRDSSLVTRDEQRATSDERRATIILSAFQEGGKVIIEVADNGQGIDLEVVRETAVKKGIATRDELEGMSEREALNLIFAEGFSTSPIITDVSGRGIGLSVVRTEMERLKGTTILKSEKGVGTTVRLELPLTIAILQVLLVEAGGVRWALPTSNLKESLKVKASAIATIENRMIIQLREHSVPVVNLADILGIRKQEIKKQETEKQRITMQDDKTVVIATSLNKQVGFIVDRVFGEEEIFIKNIGSHLGKVMGVGGATILANGEVIVILDVADLVTQAELAHPSCKPRKKGDVQKKKKVLLVEDSVVTRELEKAILENGGYAVETAIDGLDAMEKLSKTPIDVIVSDILMPRMDGFELCKNVKTSEKLQKIPVIFVTALAKDAEKRKGIEVGAQAYITKSEFDQTHLLDTIERLI